MNDLDGLRNIPIPEVMERLGFERDSKDKNNWRTSTGRVTVTGQKFFCHTSGKSGGGAFDLVMAQQNMSFRDARDWLRQQFGGGEPPPVKPAPVAATEKKSGVEDHGPFQQSWPTVKTYLTKLRHLDSALIDHLHQSGRIWSDRQNNAVFRLHNGGLALRGTGAAQFHGIRGEKGYFILRRGHDNRAYFCESPIDALSMLQLGYKGRIIATLGDPSPDALKAFAESLTAAGFSLFSSFDNDAKGEALSKLLPAAKRHKPMRKDWNQDLISRTTSK